MKPVLLVCYGSLKKGFHNNYRMGPDAQFLGHVNVIGAMFLHHNYPKLYEPRTDVTLEGITGHLAEVWQIDESNYQDILDMELGAGYEVKNIDTPWGKAKVFWMRYEYFNPEDKPIAAYNYDVLDEQTRDFLKRNMTEGPIKI